MDTSAMQPLTNQIVVTVTDDNNRLCYYRAYDALDEVERRMANLDYLRLAKAHGDTHTVLMSAVETIRLTIAT